MKLWFEGESIVTAIKNQVLMRERMAKTKLDAVFLTPLEWACLRRELDVGDDQELRERLIEDFEGVDFVREDKDTVELLSVTTEILMLVQGHLTNIG